jgi:hypothetical protein
MGNAERRAIDADRPRRDQLELIREVGACLDQLRHVVSGIEGATTDGRLLEMNSAADKLRARIALLSNPEQERRLRRSMPLP